MATASDAASELTFAQGRSPAASVTLGAGCVTPGAGVMPSDDVSTPGSPVPRLGAPVAPGSPAPQPSTSDGIRAGKRTERREEPRVRIAVEAIPGREHDRLRQPNKTLTDANAVSMDGPSAIRI